MPYELITSEHLDRIFVKLSKKDKLQFEILTRKIKEILENQKNNVACFLDTKNKMSNLTAQ